MFTLFKNSLVFLVLSFSFSIYAADTSVIPSSFDIKNIEVWKIISAILGVLITISCSVWVANLARKAPNSAVKLEQLKFIDYLVYDKALLQKESNFVIEEAFKLYFGKHIPFDIIKLFCSLENQHYAFASYVKIGNFTSFVKGSDKEKDKIKILSGYGIFLRIIALFFLVALFSTLIVYSGAFSYAFIITANGDLLNFVYAVSLLFITGYSVYYGSLICGDALDLYPDLKQFEKELKDHIVTTETNLSDFWIIIVCSCLIGLSFYLRSVFL